jgi:hypothetical protein
MQPATELGDALANGIEFDHRSEKLENGREF